MVIAPGRANIKCLTKTVWHESGSRTQISYNTTNLLQQRAPLCRVPVEKLVGLLTELLKKQSGYQNSHRLPSSKYCHGQQPHLTQLLTL